MKTTLKIFTVSLGLFFVFSGIAHAEVIKTFDSQITVNKDNSVGVVETIVYDSEGLSKHGIFRDITPKSSADQAMSIIDISITDASGTPYIWQQQMNNGDIRLKIGDPNATFQGVKTYIIRYTATNAIAHFKTYDEIYWNVTGNRWPFAIHNVSTNVLLPEGATVLQQACYMGTEGSTQPCMISNTEFSASTLQAGEGLTVAVGFPQGIVTPYAPEPFWHKYRILIVSILVPLLLFFYLFRRWKRYGRDPKDAPVVVVQYDVPESLTPMEVGVIMDETSHTKDISAELIYLATKGYIKIRQIDTTSLLGLIHSTQYKIELQKDPGDLENECDHDLMDALFPGEVKKNGTTIRLESLNNSFYKTIPKIFDSVRSAMLQKEYYTNLPKKNDFSVLAVLTPLLQVVSIALGIAGIVFIFIPETRTIAMQHVVTIGMSAIVSVLCIMIFQKLMPAKTQKGMAMKNHILGLKQYLQIAEKDRLVFHNAPEKKPELFERLLPYALVLGVENSWAKEFNDIYSVPPSWYEGNVNHFDALMLTNSLSHFTTIATTSFTSIPGNSGGGHGGFSGSGSGGGGFSGGGGGGGGGGSW